MDAPRHAFRRRSALAALALAATLAPGLARAQSPVPLEGFERGIEKTQEKETSSAQRACFADGAWP